MKYTKRYGDNYYTFDVSGEKPFGNWKNDLKLLFKVFFFIAIGVGLLWLSSIFLH